MAASACAAETHAGFLPAATVASTDAVTMAATLSMTSVSASGGRRA